MSEEVAPTLVDKSVFIRLSVAEALQARLIMWAADLVFDGQADRERAFRTHPANTLPYRALRALEEKAIVHIVEALDLPYTDDLRLHRVVLAHPSKVKFQRPEVQAFFEENRPWTDRPQRIWDLQKSINRVLTEAGQPVHLESIVITMDMVAMLQTILRVVSSEDHSPPDVAMLGSWLEKAKQHYVRRLEGVE